MSSITYAHVEPEDPNQATCPIANEATTDEEAAFQAYLATWREQIAANWTNGYCQMPDVVRQDPTLSPKAKLVYEQLLAFMWLKADRCWPSQQTIADCLHYSRRTVIRALNELYERGYIEKWRRGQGYTNYYFINPLTFPRSFRRSGPEPAAVMVLSPGAPELRLTLNTTQPRDIDATLTMCQSVTSRSDKSSQPEMSNWHPKQTKTNPGGNHQEKDKDSISTNSEDGGAVATATIRNIDGKQPSQPRETKNDGDANVSKSKSNPPPKSQAQAASAARAKTVEAAKAERERNGRTEAIAVTTGIPAAHLEELGIAQGPRRRPIPQFIIEKVTRYTRDLGDNLKFARSNITRATKLYYMACDFIEGFAENAEDYYTDLLYEAKQAALSVSNVQHRTGGRINRMPVFFACLENRFGFTPDEVEYLRSDAPLLEPEPCDE
jgi:biotin operon repressor/ribosomal protein L13E